MASLSLSFLGSFHTLLGGEILPNLSNKKVQALLIYLVAEPAGSHRN